MKTVNIKDLRLDEKNYVQIDSNKAIIITDFEHLELRDHLHIDEIIIYPGVVLQGYIIDKESKERRLVVSQKLKDFTIQLVDAFNRIHYFIKYNTKKDEDLTNCFASHFYIVLKDNKEKLPKEEIHIGDTVFRRDIVMSDMYPSMKDGKTEKELKEENVVASVLTWKLTEYIVPNEKELVKKEELIESMYEYFGFKVIEITDGVAFIEIIIEDKLFSAFVLLEDIDKIEDLENSAKVLGEFILKRKSED